MLVEWSEVKRLLLEEFKIAEGTKDEHDHPDFSVAYVMQSIDSVAAKLEPVKKLYALTRTTDPQEGYVVVGLFPREPDAERIVRLGPTPGTEGGIEELYLYESVDDYQARPRR